MSIRSFLISLILLIFVLAIVSIVGTTVLLKEQIFALSPDLMLPINQAAINELLLIQLILSCIIPVVLCALLYFLVDRYLLKPLAILIRSMNAFAETGERVASPALTGAPLELKNLGSTFDNLMDRVEVAHRKDVETSRVKSDFISTAAHQLRTPLTGIRWALEALQVQQLTEDQMALVKNATDKSHDLVAIVGTLLNISNIESGKHVYNFGSVDMYTLASKLTQDFVPLAVKKQVSLQLSAKENESTIARADEEQIKWVLNNLLENAIVYTPENGTVRVSVDAAADRIFVRIRDTGIGIPEAERGNIFERFYRAGNAIEKENAGNGLGLYIARTIATDHGGDLAFSSNQDGPGTTFTLSLPIAK